MNQSFEKFIKEKRAEFEEKRIHPDSFDQIMNNIGDPVRIDRAIKIQSIRSYWWIAASILFMASFSVFFFSEKESDKNEMKGLASKDAVVQKKNQFISSQKQYNKEEYKTETEKIALQKAAFRYHPSESASKRLSTLKKWETSKSDKIFIDLLAKIMSEDPNTNVRLECLESLLKFSGESYVRNKLVHSLSIQKDPIVQIALIRQLTELRETSIVSELEKIVNDASVLEAVQSNAYEGLFKLKM